jgi:hypothetical protein
MKTMIANIDKRRSKIKNILDFRRQFHYTIIQG